MSNSCSTETDNEDGSSCPNVIEMADFETAIEQTGECTVTKVQTLQRNKREFQNRHLYSRYGKFNYLLILSGALGIWAINCETSTMSYVLPSAECDLQLSNFDKGVLNAAVYAGMISSAFFWGYISDTFGRRKVLIYGFFIEATLTFFSSLSPTFWVLALFKLLGGIIVCCPLAVVVTYIAEMSSLKFRARATMIVGIYYATGMVVLPALAWMLIPRPWSWNILGITFKSWRMFIAVTALPALSAGSTLLFFDESPKFLMSVGRRDEALRIFRRIYSINTGLHPSKYPVKNLAEERKNPAESPAFSSSPSKGVIAFLKGAFKKIRMFFVPPFLLKSLFILFVFFGTSWGLNAIRLWMPQLFAILEEYEAIQLNQTNINETSTLCDIIEDRENGYSRANNQAVADTLANCDQMIVHETTYLYSIIVGVTVLGGSIISSWAVNLLGKKNILIFGFLVASGSVVGMYWCNSMSFLLAVASVFVASETMCINCATSIVVEYYPTNLRTMSVSLTIMIGRIGSLIGNLLFPVFLGISCGSPFFLTSAICLVCALVGLALPKAMGKPLQ